jgi:hypothetical protein
MNRTKCNCATLKGIQCTKNKSKGSTYCGIHKKKCNVDFGQEKKPRNYPDGNAAETIKDLHDNIATLKEFANECVSQHKILLDEIEKCKMEKEKIIESITPGKFVYDPHTTALKIKKGVSRFDDMPVDHPIHTTPGKFVYDPHTTALKIKKGVSRFDDMPVDHPRHTTPRKAELSKIASIRMQMLNDVLSIYKFPFILKNLDICKSVLANEKNEFTKMDDSMRIIYPNKFDIDNVLRHNEFRHPIHIEPSYNNEVKKVDYSRVNQDKMNQNLRYDKADADNIDTIPELKELRYSILGWTPVKGGITDEAYICHTWGVNMESRNTVDGKYVFGSGSTADMNKYYELLSLVMCQIAAAADEVHEQTNKKVLMRISGLGLGAWSAAVKIKLPEIKQNYLEFLKKMTRRKPWLTIMHPRYENKDTLKIENGNILNYDGHNHPANTKADPFGPPESVPVDSMLLIINAWDDRSFIGNGGSTDNTLDGWITSGTGNFSANYTVNNVMGSNFENACYLHNGFFHPTLYKDKKKQIGINC